MKTYLTLSAIALAAAATLSSGTVLAQAAAPATPEFAITGNFGITSDYRFRGLSQNNLDPAVQGGFDLAHSSGLYIGTWGSNVSKWTADSGSLELDLYGGYKTTVGDIGVDVGLIAYKYPSSVQNYGSNTEEVYVGLGYGPITFKTSYVLSKNYFASLGRESGITGTGNSAKGTMYYDLTLTQEIAPKLVASIHAGYTDYAADDKYIRNGGGGKFSYSDYNIGLAYDLNGFILGAKYFWNDVKTGTKSYAGKAAYGASGDLYKDGFAVSLTKAF
jgi:uncharacterized protein (TIGR02001 family)